MRRWRGVKSLIHDAVDRTVDLVEEGHESASRATLRVTDLVPRIAGPARLVDEVRRASTAGVLATIRGVNRLVEQVTDAGLDAVERAIADGAGDEAPVPMRSDAMITPAVVGDAALGLVNGFVGDRLHARGNPLDLGMRLRHEGAWLEPAPAALHAALPHATRKVALFVHGLGATEWSWCLKAAEYHGDPGASFGTLLARDLAFTPVWVRYNTGRHVSENGRALAALLEELVAAWPVPVEELLLVGHSMGGLVVRSACHYARGDGRAWPGAVRRVICLGSPHRGAALERVGHVAAAVLGAIDLPATRVAAAIARGRSAGIKDLRGGSLVDEDWLGRDLDALGGDAPAEVPLLDDVAYWFVSATVTADPEHPVGRLVGDLLVRVPSAAGPDVRHGAFRIETAHFGGVLHHELQNHPDVYEQIRRICAGRPDAADLENVAPGAPPR